MQRNGRIFLQDVINKAIVCYLTPTTSYQTASPCNPVYVLNTKQQALFIRGNQHAAELFLSPTLTLGEKHCKYEWLVMLLKSTTFVKCQRIFCSWRFSSHSGDLDTSCSSLSQGSSQSQLFVFRFGESDTIKRHIVSHPESPQEQKTLSHVTPEELCNLYLEQRFALFCLYNLNT